MLKKLKILFINDRIYGGGTETVFLTNIEYFIKLENTFEVYSAYCGKNHLDTRVKDHCSLDDSQKGFFKGFKYLFNIRNFLRIYKFLRKTKPDIIHIHNFYGHISPSLLLALRLYKKFNKDVKLIQTLHDYSLVCPNSSLFNYNFNKLCTECLGKDFKINIIFNRCYHGNLIFSSLKFMRTFIAIKILKHKNLVDIFIVPSNFLKNILKEEGLIKEKIFVLPNPIDEVFVKNALSKEENLQKENIILYIGRLSFEKGVNILINAWTNLIDKNKNWNLYIVGDGPMRDELKKRTQNINNIKFTGWLNKEDVIKMLKRSKILVLPSIWFENQPMVILEAIVCKVVSLVRNIGGMKELSENYKTVYTFDNDKDLVEKLAYLMTLFENNKISIIDYTNDFNEVYKKHSQQTYVELLKSIYS